MNFYKPVLRLAVIAATLVAAACADLGTQPDRLIESSTPALAKGGRNAKDSTEAKNGKKEKKGPKVKGKTKKGEAKEGKAAVRKGAASNAVASAWIDSKGGVLTLGEHTLYVPAGAVSKETLFSMREANHLVEGVAVVALDMKATRGRGQSEDVGKAGFDRPVTLCIGYADVDEEITSEDEADLIWYVGNGQNAEFVDASQSVAEQFCGSLDHFSLWGIAWP